MIKNNMYTAKTKNDIITCVAQDYQLHKEIGRILGKNIDDLMQELYLILLEKPDKLILGLNKRDELKWFILKIISNQIKSGPYYRQYIKYSRDAKEYSYEVINEEDSFHVSNETKESILTFIDDENIKEAKINKEEKIVFIKQEIDKLDWYSKEIVLRYLTHNTSCRKLSKELKIPVISLFNTFNKARNEIKIKYKNK